MSRPIDADALYQAEKLLETNIVRQDKVASELLEQILYDIQHFPTLTPPNEPLTLEQLREMDGEPAYIPETNCWVLVTKNPFVPLFTWPDGEQCSAYDWYEQVGPVYRRPPEGEGNA